MDWINKHEPKTFDELILHPNVRHRLTGVMNRPQNMLLSGPPGIGKGTFCNVYFNTHPEYDCLNINGSLDGKIDIVRDKIKPFCGAGGGPLFGYSKFKFVVINEAENLSKNAQLALRELIETANKKLFTYFIFMTNKLVTFKSVRMGTI